MPAVSVARVLEFSADQLGLGLLDLPEDQWFDRKHPRIAPRELADAIMGFANAEGGTIAVGVHDGRVLGVNALPSHVKNVWRQAPLDFLTPPLRLTMHELACVNSNGEPDHVFIVDVETSQQVHSNQRDEVYLRVGDENRKLTFQQRRELLFEKGQASFENIVIDGASRDDLDDDLVSSYAAAVRVHPDILLKARGLVAKGGALTSAGLLLFGRSPQVHYPQALVRVLRYGGTSRETGARQQLRDDVRCEGPIPNQLTAAIDTIHRLLPTRRTLGRDGRFEQVGIVPRDAWLEGVVNAVIHRSYSALGDHIRVAIFDDRIEIESPGRFPGLVDLSDPNTIGRFARNPRIARVCADLHFGQELGEGVRRIFEEMRLARLGSPEYAQTAGSVLLRLSGEAIDRDLERALTDDNVRELFRALRNLGRASTGDLVAETRQSRPLLLARLRRLQEAGVIEWVGKSAKDPRAFWQLRRDA